MALNLILLLLFVLSLVQFAIMLRKMEADIRERSRKMQRLEEDHMRLKGACEGTQELRDRAEKEVEQAKADVERLKDLREAEEVELRRATEARKDRLFVIDRHAIVHQKLWEVTISNESMSRSIRPTPTAPEWLAGRIIVLGANGDRDARHRAESKYPSALGYRLGKVERFRRG